MERAAEKTSSPCSLQLLKSKPEELEKIVYSFSTEVNQKKFSYTFRTFLLTKLFTTNSLASRGGCVKAGFDHLMYLVNPKISE